MIARCDSQGRQEEFVDRALYGTDNAFTERPDCSENGIIRNDPNDWQIAPAFPAPAIRICAFPNPAPDEVNIEVTVSFPDVLGTIAVYFRTSDGDLAPVPGERIETQGRTGVYPFVFSTGIFGRAGLHRIVILGTGGEILSYGDIQVE